MFYRIIALFFFQIVSFSTKAQFGLRTSYNINRATTWDNFFTELTTNEQRVFSNSISLMADYWVRLPNKRIEFYPNISFHQANTSLENAFVGTDGVTLGLRQVGVGVLTHIYLLDLIGDCDCPTFSKQGGLFKKGFFLLAGIGADFSEKKVVALPYADGNVDFKAAIGAGLDIGVTDLITLSPYIQYQYYPAISWHELGPLFNLPERNVETQLGQIQAGIRIGFRPDYGRSF